MTFIKIFFMFFRESKNTMMSPPVPDDLLNPMYGCKEDGSKIEELIHPRKKQK